MSTFFRPRTSRVRGGHAFEERRTNAWAALIGFLLGRGYSSVAISGILDDGTDDGTVRRMASRWGLPTWGRKYDGVIVVPATQRMRANLLARAQQNGLGLEEYCKRMLICGSMPVDRYRDIVRKDQFEDVT